MNLPSPNFKDKKTEKSSDDFISFSTPSTPYKSHTSPNLENNFSHSQQKYKSNNFQNHRNNFRGNNYKQNWNNRQNNRYQQNQNRQRYNSGNSPNASGSGEVSWSVDAKGQDNRRSGGGRNNDNRNNGRKGYFHPSMLENPWQRLEDRMDRSKWRTEEENAGSDE
ncbi:hypothetical protein ACFFRR_010489 [Megaselia abdita]